ncbi:ankyrin repeat and MYND domain-containing protein 2-like isoform X1 [Saccostrea echinata]|uniref:ankyrin repeat and MYND domain-containing protein 2-like isoform X1 n=1 Tax=Saccostrea echinata TaxID=191078 RepID=UPI002A7EB811|nr:ankyrin repeat and MYND domain-containing protein 2-like isoform X1 [Saccostrea echinata]
MATTKSKNVRENEQKLLDAIVNGNLDEVRTLLKDPDVRVDFTDETGMTPLQHAAFRGHKEMVELFLANGANVNSDKHENSYSTLMFAALSGNAEVTRLVLEAGAKVDHVNSVGRTAAQMAAFVGQHQCVSVINNFFPKEQLLYFTKPQGLEKEPKLPPEMAPALCKMINMPDLHPVKLCMYLQDHPGLLEAYQGIVRLFEILCERSMKARDTNDIFAMKTHYYSVLFKTAGKMYKEKGNIDSFIKSLIRGRESDGFPEFQEKFLRQVLREFPYAESELLQQMVRNLANTQIGDHPTALYILCQGINGQKFMDQDDICSTCGSLRAQKKCSACKMVCYCNQLCQKLHWSTHKKFCKKLAEEYKQLEEKKKEEEKEKERQEQLLKDQQQKTNSQQEKQDKDITENGVDKGSEATEDITAKTAEL